MHGRNTRSTVSLYSTCHAGSAVQVCQLKGVRRLRGRRDADLSLPIGRSELKSRPMALEDSPHLPCELMHLRRRGQGAQNSRTRGEGAQNSERTSPFILNKVHGESCLFAEPKIQRRGTGFGFRVHMYISTLRFKHKNADR